MKPGISTFVLELLVDRVLVVLEPGLEVLQGTHAQDLAIPDRHRRRRRLGRVHRDDLLRDEDGDWTGLLFRRGLGRYRQGKQ